MILSVGGWVLVVVVVVVVVVVGGGSRNVMWLISSFSTESSLKVTSYS